MAMTAAQRETTISAWIKPSSDNEKTQQNRAERMVREAIAASPILVAASPVIYTKGSYPNNTNVRRDSDVDVVVELQSCVYYDYFPGTASSPFTSTPPPYTGSWTFQTWRAAVLEAVIAVFDADGKGHVTPGAIAINIDAVTGSRPSVDVVPSFLYHRYDSPDRSATVVGSCVFPSTGGEKIVNWPHQQLVNGQTKNRGTSRYKNYVRALKNAENVLAATGVIDLLPSYFMECLVYNVPDDTLRTGTLAEGFGATLAWMFERVENGTAQADWVEPNELKYLFEGHRKWSTADASKLILETWEYLGYGD